MSEQTPDLGLLEVLGQALQSLRSERGPVETPSVLGGEELGESVADGTHGDDGGHEGGES